MYALGLLITVPLATVTLYGIAYILAMTTNPDALGGWAVVFLLTCSPVLFSALGWLLRSCKTNHENTEYARSEKLIHADDLL